MIATTARRDTALRIAFAVVLLLGVGCSRKSVEDRAREQAEKIQHELVDVDAVALDQKAPADLVSEVQRNLTTINEYQGEINGTIDSVTVNAIQSFQRTAGLKDDGIITPQTREKLAAAAKASTPPGSAAGEPRSGRGAA
jgi:peptidoglycan hydrolase-like protein with peptidoglycan-binding domain